MMKDLGMIELHPDPDDPNRDRSKDDEDIWIRNWEIPYSARASVWDSWNDYVKYGLDI